MLIMGSQFITMLLLMQAIRGNPTTAEIYLSYQLASEIGT
jgi:hypothetical protein